MLSAVVTGLNLTRHLSTYYLALKKLSSVILYYPFKAILEKDIFFARHHQHEVRQQEAEQNLEDHIAQGPIDVASLALLGMSAYHMWTGQENPFDVVISVGTTAYLLSDPAKQLASGIAKSNFVTSITGKVFQEVQVSNTFPAQALSQAQEGESPHSKQTSKAFSRA